ncbi:MAG: DUF5689 domain-containing protein [Bacteroidota bacterium]
MKNKTNIILTAIIALLLAFTSCQKEEMDVPPFIIPTFTVPAGDTLLTIAELKAMPIPNPLTAISHRYWIQGVVTGNDESGNIYKSLFIQDATGGIVLSLNKKLLYLTFKQGQQIYVKLQDIYVGLYGGTPQVGGLFNGSVGQLADLEIPNHLFKNGKIGLLPVPQLISTASDLSLPKVQTLVQLDSVSFSEAGQPYAIISGTLTATNRNLTLKDGTPVVLRNSIYATFKDSLMPAGSGSIIGILGNFNGAYQLTIRNTADVFGFTTDK